MSVRTNQNSSQKIEIANVDLFRYESINLPIDTLVIDLTRVGEEDDTFGESECV